MERAFKEILADFLKNRKMSPQSFSVVVGVGKSSVRAWLKGNAKPSFLSLKKNLPRILDFFRLLFGHYRREKENTEIKLRKKGALGAGGKRIFPFPSFFRL